MAKIKVSYNSSIDTKLQYHTTSMNPVSLFDNARFTFTCHPMAAALKDRDSFYQELHGYETKQR